MRIILKNVSLFIGDNQILNEINHLFEDRSVNFIHGKNGSGKTSLLKCILGIFNDYTGEIIINEINLSKENQNQFNKEISFLIDKKMFYKDLSVQANLQIFQYYYQIKSLDSQLISLYNDFELVNFVGEKAFKLSEGFQKKLSIILSLINNANLIILDEPYNFLDSNSISRLNEYLELMVKNENKTVIVSTHQEFKFENLNHQVLKIC